MGWSAQTIITAEFNNLSSETKFHSKETKNFLFLDLQKHKTTLTDCI